MLYIKLWLLLLQLYFSQLAFHPSSGVCPETHTHNFYRLHFFICSWSASGFKFLFPCFLFVVWKSAAIERILALSLLLKTLKKVHSVLQPNIQTSLKMINRFLQPIFGKLPLTISWWILAIHLPMIIGWILVESFVSCESTDSQRNGQGRSWLISCRISLTSEID